MKNLTSTQKSNYYKDTKEFDNSFHNITQNFGYTSNIQQYDSALNSIENFNSSDFQVHKYKPFKKYNLASTMHQTSEIGLQEHIDLGNYDKSTFTSVIYYLEVKFL